MNAVSPGTQIELFPKILRVRGYFQFFLNFFFQKIVQKKNPEKSEIRLICLVQKFLEVREMDPNAPLLAIYDENLSRAPANRGI